MSLKFDSPEEAADLVVTCSICDKHRTFDVVEVFPPEGTKFYSLIRCTALKCETGCQCPIPSPEKDSHDHREIMSSVYAH